MAELPKVYAKKIVNDLHNNRDLFFSRLLRKNAQKNITKEIDSIFHSKDFVYKSEVEITLKDEVIVATLVGKTGTFILTMDGKRIPIQDIIDIKKLG